MPQIQCPHCGQMYELIEARVPQFSGQTITCARCQKSFAAPDLAAPPPPIASKAPNPPQVTAQYAQPQRYVIKGRNPLAITSFVLAFVGFLIPLVSVAAVIVGVLAVRKAQTGPFRGKGLAIAGICVGAVSFLFMGCVLWALPGAIRQAHENANRVRCASNMRAIGQTILLYSIDNNSAYPETLEQILVTQDIPSDAFICASTSDTPAPGNDPIARAKNLSKPGHLSYIYVGKGLTNQTAGGSTVVLYEPLTNHGSKGMNVLWGDGHVTWEPLARAQYIITQVNARQNPPP